VYEVSVCLTCSLTSGFTDYHNCRSCAIGLPGRIRLVTQDPRGVGGYIVVRGEPDITAKLVDIGGGKGLRGTRNFIKVHSRSGVIEECLDVGWQVLIVRVQIYDGCCKISVCSPV
jgi:hypothetical protein